MSLEQYEPDANWGPQNPTSGTPKPNRTHQVQVGDTLDRIAPATTATRRSGGRSPPPTASPTRSTCGRAASSRSPSGVADAGAHRPRHGAEHQGQRRRHAGDGRRRASSTSRRRSELGMPSQLTIRFSDPTSRSSTAPGTSSAPSSRSASRTQPGRWSRCSSARSSASASTSGADRSTAASSTSPPSTSATAWARRRRCARSRSRSTPTSSSTIAREQGLRAQVEDTTIKFDYLIQTTTNYAFLDEIAFRTGFEWRVEDKIADLQAAAARRRRSRSRTARTSAGCRPGSRAPARRPTSRSARGTRCRSRSSSATQTIANARSAGRDRRHERASATTGRTEGEGVRRRRSASSSLIAVEQRRGHADRPGPRGTASRPPTSSVRCECLGNPTIKAGATVEIESAGTKLERHVLRHLRRAPLRPRRRHDDDVLDRRRATRPRSSTCSAAAASASAAFGKLGLTIGIVTNNKDPDGVGRVRVKFPPSATRRRAGGRASSRPARGSHGRADVHAADRRRGARRLRARRPAPAVRARRRVGRQGQAADGVGDVPRPEQGRRSGACARRPARRSASAAATSRRTSTTRSPCPTARRSTWARTRPRSSP